MKAKILAQNIARGSGGHGLKVELLEKIFAQHEDKLDDLCYTFQKVISLSGPDYFSTQDISIGQPHFSNFTIWRHIDSKHDESWGFSKKDAGCYLYGYFPEGVPTSPADFLGENTIYIGESRAVTRNCMLGRRTDFKGTIRNERLSPYGCGTAFKNNYKIEDLDNCYQAYLPMHPSLVKDYEMELLCKYYEKHSKIPVCNPSNDLRRVKLRLGL